MRCWCRSTTTASAPWKRAWRQPEDIDTAIKVALGYKMGPLELIDLIGLDTQVRLCEAFYPVTLDPRAAAPPLLKRMVAAGRLGRKSGRGFFTYDRQQDVRSLSMRYAISSSGESRSFPAGDAFLARRVGATARSRSISARR